VGRYTNSVVVTNSYLMVKSSLNAIKGIAYSIAANQIVQLANQGLEIVGRTYV